uniref:DELLA protein n=1 Tax=Anthurium amnicola TaxID=1678845 RepID=A0A1D1XHP4_9ARAE
MKREYTDGAAGKGYGVACGGGLPKVAVATGGEGQQRDELLAALGYKVRSSDMTGVALKLEQLEVAMASGVGGVVGAAPDENAVHAHLASDTVHYNPSDLSSWLDSMLSEINAPPPQSHAVDHSSAAGPSSSPPAAPMDDPSPPAESAVATADFQEPAAGPPPDCDLHGVPGYEVIYGMGESAGGVSRDRKRFKSMAGAPAAGLPLPVVLVDPQETGIRLVHTLMACAEAVQRDDLQAAEAMVRQIGGLAASQGAAMRKVATYFADALARRIYRLRPPRDQPLVDAAVDGILQRHFYDSCPHLKFAHFTANQAILEAFAGRSRVHVVDFGVKQGLQWPPLMQALALRSDGPPSFRLTGVGPPQPDNADALHQVGLKLAQLAATINVEFEYRGFVVDSLADLEPHMLGVPPAPAAVAMSSSPSSSTEEEEGEEAVAVNSVFELHRLLATPGAMEKVLGTVRAVRPRVVTVVEQEADHNGPSFLARFNAALHYYSAVFDSLEGCAASGSGGGSGPRDRAMADAYLGRQICNVVACEGAERTERHETATRWRAMMRGAGFAPVHLGSDAFNQASMLLELFGGGGGGGYGVEEKDGCLVLGWHARPLVTTSAWRLADSAAAIR